MEHTEYRLRGIAKILIIILAGLIPIWFVPLPINVEFGREATFLLLITAIAMFWLIATLVSGKIRFVHSLGLYAAGLLALTVSASTVFSRTPFYSAFLADVSAEKWSTLIVGLVLMAAGAHLFSRQRDTRRALLIFLLSAGAGATASLINLVFQTSLLGFVGGFAENHSFNAIGTINGLALLHGAALVVALGFVFAPLFREERLWIRACVGIEIPILLVNLLLVHFHAAWVLLLVASTILSGLTFLMWRRSVSEGGVQSGFDWRYGVSLAVFALSMVMTMVSSPLFKQVALPAEVSPSLTGTLAIARAVYKEGTMRLLLGSGPATFASDWTRYRDAGVNQTQFWDTRFHQGYSWASTVAITTGVVGTFAFLLFIVVLMWLFLRAFLLLPWGKNQFLLSAFMGFVSMVLAAFLYPANLAFVLLLFLFAGMLFAGLRKSAGLVSPASEAFGSDIGGKTEVVVEAHKLITNIIPIRDGESGVSALVSEASSASMAVPDKGGEGDMRISSWWDIREQVVRCEAPWLVFLSSLAVIMFLSLGISFIYYEIGRIQSAFAQQAGINAFAKGDIDKAILAVERATRYEPNNAELYRALAEIRMEKIRNLIHSAAQGTDVRNEFETTVLAARQNLERSRELNPDDPVVWRAQGQLYELIIPFVDGAQQFAFSSYRKARELDPLNPSIPVELSRAGITFADRLQITLNQGNDPNQQAIAQAREQVLKEVGEVLGDAVRLKPDFAIAHFLLSQGAIRTGNAQSAIESTERAKLAAPFDIGIAFQLGLLYYQSNNLPLAQAEFERAVSLNAQYSNARYFLGLIYDRGGNAKAAIEQFEEIEKYNPDNAEVKKILKNLHNQRPALNQIVPPAEPPEKRKKPPI